MCKVGSVARVNDENRSDAWAFMMVLGQYMSQYNNDGLGYAAFDKSGKIFGEKWLINQTAFTDLTQMKGMGPGRIKYNYSFFGEEVKRDEAQAIILHTRMATCERGIKNTHPFVNDLDNPTSVIIHNGVIGNHKDLTKKYSTCDSEVIVHLYEELKVAKDFAQVSKVMDQLNGWFTVLGLSTDINGTLVMDAFTDSPRLNSYFIPELQTRVFSTAANDIAMTASKLGMTCIDHKQIKSNSAFRLNAVTGELMTELTYSVEEVQPYSQAQLEAWLRKYND